MNYQFEEPGSSQGDRFSAEQAQNRRLIVVPVEYIPMMQVSGGRETDAIKLNVVDLQGGFNGQTGTEDPAGAVYMGCLWFGGRLIGAFRNSLGKLFVGYVGKERTSGGFQAWQFYSLTQDQQTVQLATTWLQNNPDFMETCQHDVHNAQTQWMNKPPGQPEQQQGQWMVGQQANQPAPMRQPSPPQPGPAPMPVQPPLPPPMSAPPSQVGSLNPQYQAYQASAAAQQSAPPAPPAPQSPAPADLPPTNQTVMERLRAQREQGQEQQGVDQIQGNMPY